MSKKTMYIVGGIVAVLIGYVLYRRMQSQKNMPVAEVAPVVGGSVTAAPVRGYGENMPSANTKG